MLIWSSSTAINNSATTVTVTIPSFGDNLLQSSITTDWCFMLQQRLLIIQPNFTMQETFVVQISFYNSIGNKTFSFCITLTPQGININMVDLSNGIYLCMVQHVTEQWQQTIVVQH